MRSIEFRYALHRRRDVPLIPVSLRTGGKCKKVLMWVLALSKPILTIRLLSYEI